MTTLTPPEAHTQSVMRQRNRAPRCSHVEWHGMESAPRDRAIRALVHGREVRVQWSRTPHLPLVGWCYAGTDTPCEPNAWREIEDSELMQQGSEA